MNSAAAGRRSLAAAFMVSIADLFLGAAAIVLVVLVMASTAEQDRTLRGFDVLLACGLTAAGENGLAALPQDWLDSDITHDTTLPTGLDHTPVEEALRAIQVDRLLMRIGVLTPRDGMSCFRATSEAVAKLNAALGARGVEVAPAGVVAVPVGN